MGPPSIFGASLWPYAAYGESQLIHQSRSDCESHKVSNEVRLSKRVIASSVHSSKTSPLSLHGVNYPLYPAKGLLRLMSPPSCIVDRYPPIHSCLACKLFSFGAGCAPCRLFPKPGHGPPEAILLFFPPELPYWNMVPLAERTEERPSSPGAALGNGLRMTFGGL